MSAISQSSVIMSFLASATQVPISKAPTESSVVSRDTHLPQTCHEWNNWILFGGIYYEERSCAGRAIDIKGLRGRKWPRAGQIEKARWERESGHRVFESSSWDPDDRVVFWNLRAKAQKWAFPPRRGMGQEGRLWLSKHPQLYLYYIFSSPRLFQREERAVFRFPIRFGLCLLFPYSVSDNAFVSGAMFTRGPHGRTVFTTERYIQSVVKCGESDGRFHDCFVSPVFQWGPQLGRNSLKNNGT